jgi:hypothetical protein
MKFKKGDLCLTCNEIANGLLLTQREMIKSLKVPPEYLIDDNNLPPYDKLCVLIHRRQGGIWVILDHKNKISQRSEEDLRKYE